MLHLPRTTRSVDAVASRNRLAVAGLAGKLAQGRRPFEDFTAKAGAARLLGVSRGHLVFVRGERRQHLALLLLRHLEEVECSREFGGDFVELRG